MLNKLQIVKGIKAGAFFGDDLGKGSVKMPPCSAIMPKKAQKKSRKFYLRDKYWKEGIIFYSAITSNSSS